MLRRISKVQTIALGFFLIILLGTGLLLLPISARGGETTTFLQAAFTATSATCVTGLAVVDTYSHWSLFGQIVILLLIQVGGLGFITIGVFFSIFLRRKIGLRERNLIQESVNTLDLGGTVGLVRRIVPRALLIEGVGAFLLFLRFLQDMPVGEALWNGIFHGISAFCNAGFDLMGKTESYSSFVSYSNDLLINVVLMLLILIGGIGFLVWDDLEKNKWHVKKYMLHTKIVLFATGIFMFLGAVGFFLFEREGVLQGLPFGEQLLDSLFASVTARTAGFNTTDIAAYAPATKLLLCVLMFIGAAPGSTAGGIKVTTVVVLLLLVIANLRNRRELNIFKRRLDEDSVRKASTVFLMNLSLALVAMLVILAIQPMALEDVLFEVSSAIGTVGMTTGITRDLTVVPRCVLILLMFCGRIGSMSFALSFLEKNKKTVVKLPQERITIG